MSPNSVTLTAGDKDPAQSPCARQLQQGVRLRFEPRLESEFRRNYIDQNIDRLRAAIWLGTSLIFVIAAIDFWTLDAEIRSRVALAKLLILLPVPLATLWVAYHPLLYRLVGGFMIASILAASLGIVAVHAVSGQAGFVLPYDSLLLAVLFCYFVSGLLLPASAICALGVTLAALAGEFYVGLAPKTLVYHGFHLVAANIMGIMGSYMLERVVRLNYLHAGAANELAGLDVLTNLSNLRVFNDKLRRRWQQAESEGAQLGLLLVDIDYCKRYNDAAGHVAADKAVQQVAKCVGDAARRPIDVVARLDDDEFAVLLYSVERGEAEAVADKLVGRVRALHLHHPDSPIADDLTISIGLGLAYAQDLDGPEALVAQADEALRQAKHSDRNQVRCQQFEPVSAKVTPLRAS